jgi:hypothetical protein
MSLPFTLRDSAIGIHEMFISLVEAGFTEDQAMELVKTTISAQILKEGGGNTDQT